MRDRSWTWSYRIIESREGRLVADGRTVQVMYDYAANGAVPISAELRRCLAAV